MEVTAVVAAIVSVLGATISIIATRTQAEKEVGDLYDQMVKFRVDHPEVMRLSRLWKPCCLQKVYRQENSEDKEWVTYYSYVELCLGYCNTALAARHPLGLSGRSFQCHHGPLVKLLLTEHNPIVEDLLREGKYISPQIRAFRDDLSKRGWNWQEEHKGLSS